ncbi:hypothetical protein LTR37_001044 [Vermiconidia calcicola]|uniref:Uncharacterized protein n=1 Tax=Vermiconidia calcicola TaxID=1690605 RepID=A0ACC3NWD0_9PEZI|nr:hypothetical protein LTR37_001044 [Vermiconidia calcicola]
MAFQRVALITAGTAGLGAQVARILAPDFRVVCRYKVVNYANNQSRAQSLLEELNGIPNTSQGAEKPRFEAIQADVGDRDAIKRLVEDTVAKFGRLVCSSEAGVLRHYPHFSKEIEQTDSALWDVVVSNHGWTRITNFADLDEGMPEEDWDKCFIYNVKSHLWLLHAARTELDKTEGAFITTASLAGVKPSGSSLAYSVTKAAQIHLSKALAQICAPKIRCNTVSPGLIMTEWGLRFSEEKINATRNNSKLKRLATVEDCADAVRMLATNKSMTGQNIVVESGALL